jgi:hypothetical protein
MSRKKGRLVVDPVNPPLVDIFSLADLQTVLDNNTSVTPTANKIPKADGSGKINTGYLNASTTPTANTIPIADGSGKINTGYLNASTTPTVNAIPIADSSGKINTGYLNASTTPTANTIPIAGSNNKLNANWLDFVQNFGTSGYCKLPNGLILQWGITNVIPNGEGWYITTITFPIAFPNNIFTAVAVGSTATNGVFHIGGPHDTVVINVFTKTSFQVRLDSNAGWSLTGVHPINWMAIGY